jgi:hypothetical protein
MWTPITSVPITSGNCKFMLENCGTNGSCLMHGIKDSNGTNYEYQQKGHSTKGGSLALQIKNPTLHYLG